MNKISNKAVSNMIGTVALLGIAVGICAVLFSVVLSSPTPQTSLKVTIVGTVIGDAITIEHRGGDDLPLDTIIKIILSTKQINQIYQCQFTVMQGLDDNSIIDDKWSVGEQFKQSLNNLTNFTYDETATEAEVMIVDPDSNTVVMMGTLDIRPLADIGVALTVDNDKPHPKDIIHINITVTNYRSDVNNITGVQIKFKLLDWLVYISHDPSAYTYDNPTGIWTINEPLEKHQSKTLTITALVNITLNEPVQLAMILDGSGSISSGDWRLMKDGLVNAINDSSIFPHDESVELTVIQFGRTFARVEIKPILVNNTNYGRIIYNISNMSQMNSTTPLACGIRLAADQLYNIGNFTTNKKQIINLVTDGVANVNWNSGYTGTYQGYDGWCKGDGQYHTGAYSANSRSNRPGNFTCDDLDTTGATSIMVDFWYRVDDTENGDLYLYFYDGNTYNRIVNLSDATEDRWNHYTYTTTSSQYFKQNFRVQFRSQLGSGENVWIDDVSIKTNTKELLNDSFEGAYWAENWWNPGLKSAEEASLYLNKTLQMTNDQDEFNSLGVGVGGMYGGPDVDWLKNKIVWPQPGYIWLQQDDIAPPSGWVKTITSWQEFQKAIKMIFQTQLPHNNQQKAFIINLNITDPNLSNNEALMTITLPS